MPPPHRSACAAGPSGVPPRPDTATRCRDARDGGTVEMGTDTTTSTDCQEAATAGQASPHSGKSAVTRMAAAPRLAVNKSGSAGSATSPQIKGAGASRTTSGTAATMTWTSRAAGPLPATGCCGPACAHQLAARPAHWQPLPFEADEPPADGDSNPAPRPAAGQELEIARTLTRLCAEVGWGLRPAHQCVAWSSRHAYDALSKRHLRAKAIGRGKAPVSTLTVIGVRAQVSTSRTMECSAVVLTRREGRVRASALALRAVYRRGSWWVTAVEM